MKRNTLEEAVDQAAKEAETDSIKRALRLFGEGTGNCLYHAEYRSVVEHLRAQEPRINPRVKYRLDDLLAKPRTRQEAFGQLQAILKEEPSQGNPEGTALVSEAEDIPEEVFEGDDDDLLVVEDTGVADEYQF